MATAASKSRESSESSESAKSLKSSPLSESGKSLNSSRSSESAKSAKPSRSSGPKKSAKSSPSSVAPHPSKPSSPPKQKPSGYCGAVAIMDKGNVHIHYHDKEYGFPIAEDNQLFARLILEINQAGLSWTTILNKKDNFFRAFDDFDIAKVARYGQRQIDRLLQDAGIIRNKLKIEAAIGNARRIQALQKEFGSFKNWLDHHHPLTKDEWVKLFKNTFRFTGGEIVGEFLMSSGYLPGAHAETCPIYKKILKQRPAWMTKKK